MTLRTSFFATLFGGAALVSCSDNNTEFSIVRSISTSGITIKADIDNIEYDSLTLIFTNISTNEKTVVDYNSQFDLLAGIYDVEVNASAKRNTLVYSLYGKSTSITISDSKPELSINIYVINATSTDFIIEEIFFTGTLYPNNSQYVGDNYIKIYNNTDQTLYADGLGIVESKFTSSNKFNYTPDIRQDTMAVQALYVVPGSGTDHPVEPGESFLICDIGIDHKATNPNSFDLSAADFEWYDKSTSASNTDIDSESVPNLDKWYCYSLSIFSLHNQGLKSYALVRIPNTIAKEKYLVDYKYDYEYINSTNVGEFQMTGEAYKISNSWIIDGVNCSIETVRLWDILPTSIDAGWTYCGTVNHDKTRYFKSVRRKVLSVNNGRVVLQDTNNSTNDFNAKCTPSLIEEQHSATNADGDAATDITYDGVTKVDNKGE